MIKYSFLILLTLFFVQDLFAQDLIVTTYKDSIECKIIKIDSIETSINRTKSNTFDKIPNKIISNFTVDFYLNLIEAKNRKYYYNRKSNLYFGIFHNTFFNYISRNKVIPRGVILNSMNQELSYVAGVNFWRTNNKGFGFSFDHFTSKSEYLFDNNIRHEDLKINILSFNYLKRWDIKSKYKNQIIFIPSIDIGMFKANTNEYFYLYSSYLPVEYYKKNLGLGLGLVYERNIHKHLNIGVKAQYRFSQVYKVYRKANELSELQKLINNEKLILSKFQLGVYLNLF